MEKSASLTLADVIALHEIEDNPLSTEDIEMFEMFEREGWSHERRRAYILEQHGFADTATDAD